MKIESMPGYNVRSVKKDTKRSSVFFTEQTLVLGTTLESGINVPP